LVALEGTYARRHLHQGWDATINDMWIAACCLVEDVPLATLNRKDFEDFAQHDGLRLI